MSEWISVRDRLPKENGTYLACIRNRILELEETTDVVSIKFAEKLYRTNTCFADLDEHPEYCEKYDHPGFYFMLGNLWDAEEVPIDSDENANEELLVTYWMNYPDPPKNDI